jgi:hypothetical protein
LVSREIILLRGGRRTRDAGAMGGSLSYLLVDLQLILRNSGEIHAPSAIQCKIVQGTKRLGSKPKLKQDWPLRKTTPSPWRVCRVVGRVQGSLTRTLNWEGGEGFLFLLSLWYHFDPGDKKVMDRPKPFSHVHLRRAVDPDWPGVSGRGPRRGGSGSKRHGRGRGFGFEFGRWLATSTERVRSRSPCGVRTRDECTKRTGR